jgi:hypothetical protein
MIQLEQYNEVRSWKPPQGLTETVGPQMVAKIYKNGYNAQKYFDEWLTSKGLKKSSFVSEVNLRARQMDADVEDTEVPCLARESFEMNASKLYGFTQAFKDVWCEGDWRPPKGQTSKGFKSKIRWGLLDLYDQVELEKERMTVESVDRERQAYAARQRDFDMNVDRTTAATDGGSNRTIAHIDD